MFLSLCTAHEDTDVLACVSVFTSLLPEMQPALELVTILQLDCEALALAFSSLVHACIS